ncbi:MAG: choice-of-anchor D domain-containing protein [Candidatus Kapabacteria bacterium]|nr:choice-of-anchor D domain-containing protein [Candidatus Kapabacteria bacterium]
MLYVQTFGNRNNLSFTLTQTFPRRHSMSQRLHNARSIVTRLLASVAFALALFASPQDSFSQAQQSCSWWAGGNWTYSFVITAPQAGTSWTPGGIRTITWTSGYGYVAGTQTLEFSSNDGASWNVLTTVSSDTRSFNWSIPTCITQSSTYRLRITETGTTYWYNCPFTTGAFSIGSSSVFTQQPQALAACINTRATFTVGLSGSFTTIEWRKDGTPVGGGSTSFTIPSVQPSDSGSYSVRVVDICGRESISSAARLTVRVPPTITQQPPALINACENSVVDITCAASGSLLTYEWFKDGVAVPGGTAATLRIPNALSSSAGSYTCVVSGACAPSATSSVTVLNVVSRPKITQEPRAAAVCPGGNTVLSVVATGSNLVYQWQKNGVNVVGGNNASLNLTNFTYDMNGDYQCVITSNVPNPANCPVTASSAKVRVSGIRPPTVTAQPVGADVCLGKTANLVVEADGFDLQYQWMKDSVAIPGATQNELTLANIKATQTGKYSCKITGSCGLSVVSNGVMVNAITSPAITKHPVDVTVVLGNQLDLTFEGKDVRKVQWYKNSKPINGATNASYTITAVTKADAGVYNAVITNNCGQVSTNYATVTIKDPADDKPELTMATNIADFGEIPIGYDKSITMNALVKNTGTAVMQVTSITTTGDGFSITSADQTPFNLDPGATSSVTVTAMPTTLGQSTGALQVVTNAPTPTGTVVLSVTSVRRYTHGATLAFENVETGKSKELCITLTNTSNIDVTIDAATINGSNAADFSLVTAAPVTITAGGTKDVCLTFAPTSIGDKTASVAVTSSTGGNSSLDLTGTGIVPVSVNEEGVVEGVSVFPNPTPGAIVVRSESAIASVDIMNAAGQKIVTINGTASTPNELRWNGMDANGSIIPSGLYNVVIRSAGQTVTVPVAVVR